jgi:hypothetical protein
MTLAQLQNVDAGHLKDIMLVLVALVGIASVIMGMVRRPRTNIEPQPLEIRAATQLVSKQECELLHKATLDRVLRIESDALEQARNRRSDVGNLHEKIREVGENVSALQREAELQNQRMAMMDSKLDRMIERRP